MKLITLNTWGARAGHQNFLNFIKKNNEIDVFCLQEVWDVKDENGKHVLSLLSEAIVGGVVLRNMMEDLFQNISSILQSHYAFFRPHYGTHYGLAMFVKKSINLTEEGDIFVYKTRDFVPTGDVGNHARNIQYANIETGNGSLTIINFHGLWNGKGKTDTDDRLEQSKNILSFISKLNNPFILCGDFNLLPDTESLKMFERFGLRNLIKENNITSTRTSFYTKEHKYADYVFVSEGINVNEFKVLPDEVSDHCALYLDFE
jgi:endonuclease/exonuclease/phosphatase family metal-dependent hydrolase